MSPGQKRIECGCGQRVTCVPLAGRNVILDHRKPSGVRCGFSRLSWPAPQPVRVGGRR